MKNLKLNYFIVGSFMIAVVATLIVTVILLTGRTGDTDKYFALYDNVAGVDNGTRVLYEGFPIGQVDKIIPQQANGKTNFRVDLSVTKGWKIPQDSSAEIAAAGILASVTIGVRAGKSTEFLPPGAQIPSRETNNIMVVVGDLARDIKDITESDVKPMIARIHSIVQSISEMIGEEGSPMGTDVRRMVERFAKTAPEILENINTFSSRLEILLSDRNLKTVDGIIANMATSAKNIANVTAQLGETRKSIDGLIGEINTVVTDNKLDVERTVVDMRQSAEAIARYIESINQNLDVASRNIMEFSRAIRQNPGLLLGGTPPADNAAPNR